MSPGGAKPDCLFCRVVAGEIPSTKVFETDGVLAFRDINPGAPQHVLVIPKEHAADSVADLDMGDPGVARTWADLLAVVQQVAGSSPAFADGWRLVTNVGENGGQSVFHLHLHVLAGRRLTWPPG
jgi:histidine triad (HIT) family protein